MTVQRLRYNLYFKWQTTSYQLQKRAWHKGGNTICEKLAQVFTTEPRSLIIARRPGESFEARESCSPGPLFKRRRRKPRWWYISEQVFRKSSHSFLQWFEERKHFASRSSVCVPRGNGVGEICIWWRPPPRLRQRWWCSQRKMLLLRKTSNQQFALLQFYSQRGSTAAVASRFGASDAVIHLNWPAKRSRICPFFCSKGNYYTAKIFTIPWHHLGFEDSECRGHRRAQENAVSIYHVALLLLLLLWLPLMRGRKQEMIAECRTRNQDIWRKADYEGRIEKK